MSLFNFDFASTQPGGAPLRSSRIPGTLVQEHAAQFHPWDARGEGLGGSLSSLRQFPFNALKIDRSFLLDADVRRSDEIVRTIASLARVLGMDVTVEGLETREQVDRMRELGIERAQGFYFSPPVPAEEAQAFVARASGPP